MVPFVDAVAAVHTAVHVLCQQAWSWESGSLPALWLGVHGPTGSAQCSVSPKDFRPSSKIQKEGP